MWSTEYTATTSAAPEAVWAVLRALHGGEAIGPESDSFQLHGPFAVGTLISVTPAGQETMTSVITELEPGRVYADRTDFGGLELTFRHVLEPAGSGTTVTHRLEIDGAGADAAGPELGPAISADFPSAMAELFAAAERPAA